MQAVMQALHSGDWGKELSGYKRVRHEIRERVPEMLRPKILSAAHRGHPGARAMKSILKGSVWWPGMLTHADKWVKSCKACTLMGRKDSPMPMQRSWLPMAVWSHIAMDYNGPYQQFGGILVLLIVDLYSRFLIARPVRTTSFGNIRPVLDDVFDTFGNVESIKTDNGPPFNGAEYAEYGNSRGMKVSFSTPLDAQQNGGVESFMRVVNKGMTATSVEGGNWRKSLAETVAAHNAAISEPTGVAPDTLMFGRKLRRNLPLLDATVDVPSDKDIRIRDWDQKMGHKKLADSKRDARYSRIEVGDKVYVSRPTKKKGETNFDPTEFTVIAKRHGTLELISEAGTLIKRTTTFVKKVNKLAENEPEPEQEQREAGGRQRNSETVENPTRPELRRSERVRRAPANLRNYIHMLGWEIENISI